MPGDSRLFVYVEPSARKGHLPVHLPRPGRPLRDQHRRWTTVLSPASSWSPTTSPSTGTTCFAACWPSCPPDNPKVDSISDVVPGANWAEREIRDLVGIEPVGHRYPKRLVLPDGWPDGVHPLRKDVPWNHVPDGLRRGSRVHVRRTAGRLHGRALRAVPSHAGRAGPFPSLRRRRDGARLRVSRLHGASRHRETRRVGPHLQRDPDDGRAHLRHLRLRAQRGLRPGGRDRRGPQAAAARRVHPHHHAGDRAAAQPSAVGRAGLPHRRLRHAVHAELAHPRADHVDCGKDQRQPQDLRALRHRRRALGHHARS